MLRRKCQAATRSQQVRQPIVYQQRVGASQERCGFQVPMVGNIVIDISLLPSMRKIDTRRSLFCPKMLMRSPHLRIALHPLCFPTLAANIEKRCLGVGKLGRRFEKQLDAFHLIDGKGLEISQSLLRIHAERMAVNIDFQSRESVELQFALTSNLHSGYEFQSFGHASAFGSAQCSRRNDHFAPIVARGLCTSGHFDRRKHLRFGHTECVKCSMFV